MDLYQVGRKIRAFRLEQGLIQEALAEAADLSSTYVSHVERGRKKASLESLIRIAAALHITVDRLLVQVQESDTSAYIPEVCDLLRDCSAAERHVIFQISQAAKQALRDCTEP